MTLIEIAKIAHEVNRAYCQSIGDTSIQAWEQATEAQRRGAIFGVVFYARMPSADAYTMHKTLFDHLVADGWVYGDTIDDTAKQHPACKPYDELPQQHKIKDHLFLTIVRQLQPFITENPK